MLLHLHIKNFAIVQEIHLNFSSGFTVITGETGSGKSILVRAISIVLGERTNIDIIRTGASSCVLEILFDISKQSSVKNQLEKRDLIGDDPDKILIKREINTKNRNKITINGYLSTLATLKEIVKGLMDLSGQHDQQSLLNVDNHVKLLDSFGNLTKLSEDVSQSYKHIRELIYKKNNLQKENTKNREQFDFLRFQLDEISRIDPKKDEDKLLMEEQKRLFNADNLVNTLKKAENLLYADDDSAFDKMSSVSSEIASLIEFDKNLEDIYNRIQNIIHELEEINRSILDSSRNIEINPNRLLDLEERISDINHLYRKYGGDIDTVLETKKELEIKLDSIDNSDQSLEQLNKDIQIHSKKLFDQASTLNKKRKKTALDFEKRMLEELNEMELKNAHLSVKFTKWQNNVDCIEINKKNINIKGMDYIEFLWTANSGESSKSLVKIASGGEISRLMLAFKMLLSQYDPVLVYIFDEIDTGLGGEAAKSIAQKIHQVAKNHQTIAITHLAPIAARADHHIKVEKIMNEEHTFSHIEFIEKDKRIHEIARMIDGKKIKPTTKKVAHDMLSTN